MNRNEEHPVILLGCGVLQAELTALQKEYWPDLGIRFLNSMLHMSPEKLGITLGGLVREQAARTRKTVLIYGDCCPEMSNFTEDPTVTRVRGNNCCDLLLGREQYRRLSHEGSFFLFPEWAGRWRHIFRTELGLNEKNAADLMGDMHRKLVFLDTGLRPVPVADLKACSAYCQLPWELMTVSLEPIRNAIQDALDELNLQRTSHDSG